MSNYILTSDGTFMSEDELYHWGIKGMKWGVRRYQKARSKMLAGKKLLDDAGFSDLSKRVVKRNSASRYAKTAIAGAIGSMSLNLAAHSMLHAKYKTGRKFVSSMARSALFGASMGSLVTAARIGSEDSDN